MLRYWLLILWFCHSACYAVQAEPKRYVVEGWITNDYVSSLLTLILEASKAPDEVIELKYNKFYDLQLSHSRRVAEFAKLKGNLVMWTITDNERESFLRPIRIPIFKGLFGYRALVIRKEDQEKFANIKTQKALAELVAGQGEQWPDTEVLRVNGFSVITGNKMDNLYKMLAAKRFDYFPRGLPEIEPEAEIITKYDLMVVPNLFFRYPNPMYFFVQKDNAELANRIERGWQIILKNGVFDELFYAQPRNQKALELLATQPNYMVKLTTPDLPVKTPLTRTPYWLYVAPSRILPP